MIRCAAALAILLLALPGRAATIHVTTVADALDAGGDCALREAVEAANTNAAVDACEAGTPGADTILFTSVAGQTIVLALGELFVRDALTVGGPGARVTVNAGGASRAFRIDVPGVGRSVAFVNLTLRNGRADRGGAVLAETDDAVSFTGVTLQSNVATGSGGALWLGIGTYSVSGCTLIGNRSEGRGPEDGGGAAYVRGGALTVEGGVTRENTSASSGGAVFVGRNATLVVRRGAEEVASFVENVAAQSGGAVEHMGASLQMTGAAFVYNRAEDGGALSLREQTSAALDGVTFLANEASRSGGGARASDLSALTLRNATFNSNVSYGSATGQGGGGLVCDGGTVTLTTSAFSNNEARGAGGGILNVGLGRITMSGGSLSNNTALRSGGAIETMALPGTAGNLVRLTDVGIGGNEAGSPPGGGLHDAPGGGLHISGAGAADVTDGAFTSNRASEGGGIWMSTQAALTVRGTHLVGNVAGGIGGGGMYNEGAARPLVLDGVTLSRNVASSAAGVGGGVYNGTGGTVTLTIATVEQNTAGAAGGGLWSAPTGTLTVETTTLRGNGAPQGGGVYKAGSGGVVAVDRSLFVGNAAPAAGGGLYVAGGFATVRNSTLSGNTGGDGAGAFVAAGGLSLLSTTVARNVATGTGGGVRVVGGTVLLDNAVLGDNRVPGDSTAAGSDCAGGVEGRGVNLVEVAAGCSFSVRSPVQVEARLLPLADNGGPTLTHALGDGSPAIGAGQTTEPADQRGYGRTATPSVGAFEAGGTPPTVATEAGAEAARLALSPARPNPVRGTARLTATPAQSGPALAVLIDALGRRVRTLFDGPAEADVPIEIAVDASGLAPGVYVVRLTVSGEASAQRVTVVR